MLVIKYRSLLARYLEIYKLKYNDYLFEHEYNYYLKHLRKVINSNPKLSRLKSIRRIFHALRHTRATELYRYFNEKEMLLWFGWKDREMLDIYAHLTMQDAHDKYLKIAGLVEEKERKENETITCPQCNEVLPASAEFCLRCGYRLRKEIEIAKEEIDIQTQVLEMQKIISKLRREIEHLKKLVK